ELRRVAKGLFDLLPIVGHHGPLDDEPEGRQTVGEDGTARIVTGAGRAPIAGRQDEGGSRTCRVVGHPFGPRRLPPPIRPAARSPGRRWSTSRPPSASAGRCHSPLFPLVFEISRTP